MLKKIDLHEAVCDAMEIFASRNEGRKGILKEDLKEAILERDGDETDLTNAMIIGAEILLSEISYYLR